MKKDVAEPVMEKNDYQAKCDADDVMRAMEVIADKSRFMKAKEYLGKKKDAIETLDDLFKLKEKRGLDKEDEEEEES